MRKLFWQLPEPLHKDTQTPFGQFFYYYNRVEIKPLTESIKLHLVLRVGILPLCTHFVVFYRKLRKIHDRQCGTQASSWSQGAKGKPGG